MISPATHRYIVQRIIDQLGLISKHLPDVGRDEKIADVIRELEYLKVELLVRMGTQQEVRR